MTIDELMEEITDGAKHFEFTTEDMLKAYGLGIKHGRYFVTHEMLTRRLGEQGEKS